MKLVPCTERKTNNVVLIDIESADLSLYYVPGFQKEANRNDDDVLEDVTRSANTKEEVEKEEYETALSKNKKK